LQAMKIQTLVPRDAKALLDKGEGWLYVDVRTPEEFAAGHPEGAINLPVALRDPAGRMAPNPDFVQLVKKRFPVGSKIVFGCAAGGRSQRACEMLAAEGYQDLVNMKGGYSGAKDLLGRVEPGWEACGLPIEKTAPRERTYEGLGGGA